MTPERKIAEPWHAVHLHVNWIPIRSLCTQSGKVYKGLWRGTTVAVKVVVLANKMSGADKVRQNYLK